MWSKLASIFSIDCSQRVTKSHSNTCSGCRTVELSWSYLARFGSRRRGRENSGTKDGGSRRRGREERGRWSGGQGSWIRGGGGRGGSSRRLGSGMWEGGWSGGSRRVEWR